jgi:hypothetical protein
MEEYVYFGLNKMGRKNYTSWFSGDAVKFSAWASQKPSDLDAKDCVAY